MVLLDTGFPGTSIEIYSDDADGETRTRKPSVINRALAHHLHLSFCKSVYYFIICHISLTSHKETRVVLLDTGTPGTSREDRVRMLMERFKPTTPRLVSISILTVPPLLIPGVPVSSRTIVLLK